jgi:hypothetical protein
MQPEIAARDDVREVTAATQALVALAGSYQVATPEQYSGAGADLTRVKAAQKRLEAVRKAITQPLDAAKKAVMDFFREPEMKLADAENRIKRSMIAFSDEQDRIRREEQRRADEAARKERERIEAQARKAAESGKVEKADALEQRAAAVVAPVIHREAPTVAGINMREVWKFEVTDPDLVPRQYLSVDESKIRKVVQALKGDTKIDGVRIWPEKQMAAGAA